MRNENRTWFSRGLRDGLPIALGYLAGVSVLIEGAERDASGVIWYKVAFAGTSGYIMAEFISIQ